MVSAKTQAEDDLEPRPSKRQKLQPVHQLERPTQLIIAEGDNHRSSEELAQIESVQQLPKKRTIMSSTGFQPDREVEVGILHVVNSANKGFTGVLKHRCVAFLSVLRSSILSWASHFAIQWNLECQRNISINTDVTNSA